MSLMVLTGNTYGLFSDRVVIGETRFAVGVWQPTVLINDQAQALSEKIKNGNFAENLSGWESVGQVQVLNQVSTLSNQSKVVEIGNQNAIQSLEKNVLSQKINNVPPTQYLSFWYNLQTFETTQGFDDPALLVTINNQVVFRQPATRADITTTAGYRESGWQLVILNISEFSGPELEIKFMSGTGEDRAAASWTDIAAVSSLRWFLSPSTVLSVSADTSVFDLNNSEPKELTSAGHGQFQFSFNQPPPPAKVVIRKGINSYPVEIYLSSHVPSPPNLTFKSFDHQGWLTFGLGSGSLVSDEVVVGIPVESNNSLFMKTSSFDIRSDDNWEAAPLLIVSSLTTGLGEGWLGAPSNGEGLLLDVQPPSNARVYARFRDASNQWSAMSVPLIVPATTLISP